MKKLFIFGVQRSGTSILSSVIGELPEVAHFPETNAKINSEESKEAGQTIRLKKLEEVQAIFNKIDNKKLIVAKPLVESQNALKILNFFHDACAVWNYRQVHDVISSFIVKWNPKEPKSFFRPLIEKSNHNWRSENLPLSSWNLFEEHYSENMSIENAIALFWLMRNNLYFTQKLDSDTRIRLVSYEKMVQEYDYLQRKLNSLDIDIKIQQKKHKLNNKSIGKGNNITLSPILEKKCIDMYMKLNKQEVLESL